MAGDYRGILDDVDGIVLAVPSALHAAIGVDVLKAGKHLLVEKPMALTAAQCDLMIEGAREAGVVLAVGQVRRYMSAYRAVKGWIETGLLGQIEVFDIEEGTVHDWPSVSGAFLDTTRAGGGVFVDTGAHILDAVRWWFGEHGKLSYCDDSSGGVEADCTLNVEMKNGTNGRITLSRVRNLRNTAVIQGSKATLEVSMFEDVATLRSRDGRALLTGRCGRLTGDPEAPTTTDPFRRQAEEWLAAIKGERAEIVTGWEARGTVSWIEECYATRARCGESW